MQDSNGFKEMKLIYVDDFDQTIYEEWAVSVVPRIGEKVWLNEVYTIVDVIWYPQSTQTRQAIIKIEAWEPPLNQKVAESGQGVVHLNGINKAQQTADKALKETTNLKRQLFSIRQFLRSAEQRKKPNDGTR
jgi:hypothetical protein